MGFFYVEGLSELPLIPERIFQPQMLADSLSSDTKQHQRQSCVFWNKLPLLYYFRPVEGHCHLHLCLLYFQIVAYREENAGTAMRSSEWRDMEHTQLHKESFVGCRGGMFSLVICSFCGSFNLVFGSLV